MKITIINGPNLNLLGSREPEIYGKDAFEQYFERLMRKYSGIELIYFQSNVEGEIINRLHDSRATDGIILNAAGYTHTSVSIGDAVKAIDVPVVEVHISNVFAREAFRHTSFISAGAIGCITGFGLFGYDMAVEALKNRHNSI